MKNVWMTSQGLELHENTFGENKLKCQVTFGSIDGPFVSYESKRNKLCFQVTSSLDALLLLAENSVRIAHIENNGKVYQIEYTQYNYKVSETQEAVYVSLWEQENEEE